MKTESYFEEYNQFVTDQRNAINELEQQRNDLQAKIKADKEKYKQLVANGEDDKADELYQTTDEDERQLKAITKRLETKKDVADEIKRNKTIELLKHQFDLPSLYSEEKSTVLKKLANVVEEYNKVIDEINDVNDRFKEEFERYGVLYDQEEIYKDTEAKKALNGQFREYLHAPYINSNHLPFESNKKLKFKKRG